MTTETTLTGLTREALAALDDAGLSRRNFLKKTGVLIVAFSAAGVVAPVKGQAPAIPQRNAPLDQVDSWLAILPNENVIVYSGKCEFGQGFETVQHQLTAEELGVSLDRVWVEYCDTAYTPDQGVTSGSQSHPTEFGPGNALRQALATAREALFQMASQRLNAPVDQLTVDNGVVSVKTDSSRRVSYSQLIGDRRFNLTVSNRAIPKHPTTYTVLGKSVARWDIPAKVLGQYRYVQTVRVPGMVHGKVIRPPGVNSKLVSVDESSVRELPGNVRVVTRGDFVGVVADTEWQAIVAARTLSVKWSDGNALPKQDQLYAWMRQQPSRDTYTVLTSDVDDKLKQAAKVITATYRHPYQMHGSIASSCAVADVRGTGATGRATIWSATQGVYPQRDSVAMVLGMPNTNVRVIFAEGSGCYGCNGNDTVSFDAAILSQAVQKPVRVQFTRRDEMVAGENYGPAYTMDLKAGLDDKGQIVVSDYEAWTLTKGGRPNATTPGNIVTGALVGFATPALVPARANPPTTFNNGSNVAWSYSAGCAGGNCTAGTGNIFSERALTHTIASPFFTGPLRSPARLQNSFAHESFIDEVAAAVRADPVQYRQRHLRDPRLIDVLLGAARGANWETRPSPKPGNARTGVVSGRGIAACLYEGDNGYCGLVAEIEVNQATGEIAVKRLVASADVGPISNPDGLRNQIEGGALQGMSRALNEEVSWNEQSIVSNDWRRYPVFQFGDPLPVVETVLIDRPNEEHMGAGETVITIAAAAIGNAIFDATGVRLREVPFTSDRVLAALRAR